MNFTLERFLGIQMIDPSKIEQRFGAGHQSSYDGSVLLLREKSYLAERAKELLPDKMLRPVTLYVEAERILDCIEIVPPGVGGKAGVLVVSK